LCSCRGRREAQHHSTTPHLKEFADLRNAIVHERTDGHVIAEPNDRALAELDRLRTALMNPPTVIPKFQITVRSRTLTDSVGEAVTDMRNGSFSQLPILTGGRVVALLTAETGVRWLASEVMNELVSPWETKIEQVLPHTEDLEHYCFLSRRATLLDALSQFEDFAARGKDLDAILISHNGKPEQELLGILTLYDLPAILEATGLKRVSAT
jgi:CBS domain-containing protein